MKERLFHLSSSLTCSWSFILSRPFVELYLVRLFVSFILVCLFAELYIVRGSLSSNIELAAADGFGYTTNVV